MSPQFISSVTDSVSEILEAWRNRGVQDIFIAAFDVLTGSPHAIAAVFPKTEVQLCIMHIVRSSPKFVPSKDRKVIAADLRTSCSTATEEAAASVLAEFCQKWDLKYPMIDRSWKARWTEIVPFLSYPAEIRQVIATTTALESLNYCLWKVSNNRQAFPTSEATMKLIFWHWRTSPRSGAIRCRTGGRH